MNGFDTNFNMMQPISSGSGDVILQGDGKKPKKKLAIILGLVAIVVLVLVVVVLAVVSSGSRGGGVSAEEENKFNKFANYLLYGEEKNDAVIAEYDAERNSYFKEVLDSGEGATEYLDKLYSLYQDFYGKLPDAITENSYYSSVFEQYGDKLEFLKTYYENGMLTRLMVVDYFVQNGEAATSEYIGDFYSSYMNLPLIYDTNYYSEGLNWGRNVLELIVNYNNMGCIVEDGIDYECVDAVDTSGLGDIYLEIDNASRVMSVMVEGSERDVYDELFDLIYIIYGGSEDEE